MCAFQSHGVKYLIVGGYAMIYHSQPRFTKDIDIFVQAHPENVKALFAALNDFGASLERLSPEDFTDVESFFPFGREPRGFDILPAIPGVDFDAAWARRVETVIDQDAGIRANFISAEDLIASKLAAGRPRDLADVEDIRRATASLRPSEKRSPVMSKDTSK